MAHAMLAPTLLSGYQIDDDRRLLTPALAIYPDKVDANIDTTVRLLGGDANRWRPHVKTAKLGFIIRRYVERGIGQMKCTTTRELVTACGAGATDVLVAYPIVGAKVDRVRQIAARSPRTMVSVLVDHPGACAAWRGSRIGLFVDVNPGMDRTGIEQHREADVVALVRSIVDAGLEFRGLHYYDGHIRGPADDFESERTAHRGYDRLLELVAAVERDGPRVPEVITAGTPAFPWTLSYQPFRTASFVHRASPGTLVYNDVTTLAQLPPAFGYQPAALVVSAVVSHPRAGRVTCDAGHKTVSADAGVPTCEVLGHPDYQPLKPSEEHLPIGVPDGARVPEVDARVYLLPRHVCPTVNNFDEALIVRDGKIEGVEAVTARGREAPLPDA